MFLAIFHLHVNLLLHPKFQLKWLCGLWENVQNRFSRWQLWWPSWISDQHHFSLFRSRSHPVAKEQVSTQTDQKFGKYQKTDFQDGGCGGHLGFSISSVLAILCPLGAQMLLIKFQPNWIIVFRGNVQNWIINIFPYKMYNYHIWAWQPACSMDPDHFSNLSFPSPKEAPYEIWATLAWLLQRRSCLWNSQHFSHTNVWGPYKCRGKQTWPCRKKIKYYSIYMYDHHFN